MSQATNITDQLPLAWPSYISGEQVQSDDTLEVRYPWDGSLTGMLPKITPEQLEQAIAAALGLGIKEGVIEAMKFMTTTKTFSLPW